MPRFIKTKAVDGGYEVLQDYTYYSPRYINHLTVEKGFWSNGANVVPDPEHTDAWILHDKACATGKWDDGADITKWQASMILYDVSQRDGYCLFAFLAKWATYFFGDFKMT